MGIAASDVTGNGQVDFFVTNFHNEANTLYVQDAPGLFVDRTKAASLYIASYPFVGWGTQFLDADRDGLSDIVVVNGHVDDYRDEGGEFHMQPQFFRNLGHTTFEVTPGDRIGAYFTQKFLARGLSTLDWNRDGATDSVVSVPDGHWMSILSTASVVPKPNCSSFSLDAIYPSPAVSCFFQLSVPLTTVTLVPTASRADVVATSPTLR